MRRQAAEHGRSTEAEARAILDEAVRPATLTKLGSALVAAFAPAGGVDLDITRDPAPARGAEIE